MQHIPLQRCDINAAFKSRGGLSDVIYIKPPESQSQGSLNTVNSQEIFAVVQRKVRFAKKATDLLLKNDRRLRKMQNAAKKETTRAAWTAETRI